MTHCYYRQKTTLNTELMKIVVKSGSSGHLGWAENRHTASVSLREASQMICLMGPDPAISNNMPIYSNFKYSVVNNI